MNGFSLFEELSKGLSTCLFSLRTFFFLASTQHMYNARHVQPSRRQRQDTKTQTLRDQVYFFFATNEATHHHHLVLVGLKSKRETNKNTVKLSLFYVFLFCFFVYI